MSRRIDAGPLLVLAGASLLFVSLFVAWFEPGLEAWDVFEVLDLALAAAAVVAILAALGLVADFPAAPDAGVLPWLAGGALVVAVATLLDRPPVVGDGDADVGLWLALAGSALMAAGTLLGLARVSIAFDVAARERRERVEAVDARAGEAGPAASSSGGAGATPDAPLFGSAPASKTPAGAEAEPATGTARAPERGASKPDAPRPAAPKDGDPTQPMPPTEESPRA